MATNFLTDKQTTELNNIYTRIVKKYSSYASDTADLSVLQGLTEQEAKSLASAEANGKRVIVFDRYVEQIAKINANATRRGLSSSSIVIAQLDKALVKKNMELDIIDAGEGRYAKKLFADSQKLTLAVEREKAAGKSRSLRDFVTVTKMRQTVPNYNAQNLIDEELYTAYLEWLLNYSPAQGLAYVLYNNIFMYNMGTVRYNQLLAEMQRRAV